MPLAEKPADERERLAAVYELKLLDTPPEERFERISRLAQKLLKVQVAYIALIEGERQWFKSICGVEATEIPRGTSMCAHTLLTEDGIFCGDALQDQRLADNPHVLGAPHVRFYMSRPLRCPSGFKVGTFCTFDSQPRPLCDEDASVFRDLAAMAESEINLLDILDLQNQLRRHNRFIREVFGRFVTDQVAESLLSDPHALKLGGEVRNLTILMSDLRGFTSMSERVGAEKMIELINRYLDKMVPVIERHSGTIDEFIGDAILVLFGAPVADADHAFQAVACALEMQAALEELNKELEDAPLEMGIAVHTGDAVVGNIGTLRRMKYGVVGGAVNLTARIQGLTLGKQVLVSQETYQAVRSRARIDGNLRVKVKGLDQPIWIYEIGALE